MTGTFHIYDDDHTYEDVEVEYDYDIYWDGIGSYEYWGFRGYDKGNECCDIDNITLVKNEEYTEEDVKYIEKYISENYEKISEKLTEQVYRELENQRSDYWEGVAEDRYYRDKYGD